MNFHETEEAGTGFTGHRLGKSSHSTYLKSDAWKKKRTAVLEHAEWRCQLCNAGGWLQVHHRTYENVPNEPVSDLIALCCLCHAKFHEAEG